MSKSGNGPKEWLHESTVACLASEKAPKHSSTQDRAIIILAFDEIQRIVQLLLNLLPDLVFPWMLKRSIDLTLLICMVYGSSHCSKIYTFYLNRALTT